MNYPKISIITPNYNGGEYLEETIKSVLSQNYPNLEYIIIDGGSSDNSLDIIKKYENKLFYWVSEPDKGLYDAIQKGFDKSTGEIMAWLNSDDLYHNKSFFTIAEIFSNFKEVKWLQGIPTAYDESGRVISASNIKQWSKLDYYLGKYAWIQQESIFWHRDLWEKANSKIDISMRFAGDLDLWLRFFRYEKLYTTRALIGGFRLRSKNQLSLENIDAYIAEANAKINDELDSEFISNEEKIAINKIKKHYESIARFRNELFKPYHTVFKNRRIQKIINTYFSPPKIIDFNRVEQKFKL